MRIVILTVLFFCIKVCCSCAKPCISHKKYFHFLRFMYNKTIKQFKKGGVTYD